ncbi:MULTISPECIES: aa3-type cytochrome c oxidase subunit IV [unclassified Sphingomonas]|nr:MULTISPECIES: aa3-type cytochrome c oxidase subunit IV [unclassified Sphingomonas]
MASDGDLKAHEATYVSVTAMLKWGTVAVAAIAIAVILIIAR